MSEFTAVTNSATSGYPIETTALACPTDRLWELLSAVDPQSTVVKVFEIFNETQGISCENYLPWEDTFAGGTGYFDGITRNHLSKSAMWAIGRSSRPLIALKYECTSESPGRERGSGVVALFQRYYKAEKPSEWAEAGWAWSRLLFPWMNTGPQILVEDDRGWYWGSMSSGGNDDEGNCNIGPLDLNHYDLPTDFYKEIRSFLQNETLKTVNDFDGARGSLRLKP